MTNAAPTTELSKRVTTGVMGGALLLAILIYGGLIGVSVVAVILSLAMIYEFSRMAFTLEDQVEKRYLVLSLTWFIHFFELLLAWSDSALFVVSFLGLFTYFLLTAKRHSDANLQKHFVELALSFFGIYYLSFLPLYLPRIHESANGIRWTLLFLMIVWAGDTGAYFAGKKYGKRKLYPRVSPKKTVEGGVGGLAAGFVVTLIYKGIVFRSMPWAGVIFIPLLVGAVSQVGDFCESLLKRSFNKKDSGQLLPGHGGFLDRFDGVVFSLPVMYACIRIFSS